jgi:hypothetical protein
MRAAAPVDFVPLGIFGPDVNVARQPQLAPPEPERSQQRQAGKGDARLIEIALPNSARVCVDALVNEKALSACAARNAERDMISLAPGTKVFLACQPADLRNYVERTIMRCPRRQHDRRRGFRTRFTPHNSRIG